jgi:excisionase family DNA binding protein
MTKMKLWDYAEPPIALALHEAAAYIGVGTTKFLELVRSGLMPKPKMIGSQKRWIRTQLEIYVINLPDANSATQNVIDLARVKRKEDKNG